MCACVTVWAYVHACVWEWVCACCRCACEPTDRRQKHLHHPGRRDALASEPGGGDVLDVGAVLQEDAAAVEHPGKDRLHWAVALVGLRQGLREEAALRSCKGSTGDDIQYAYIRTRIHTSTYTNNHAQSSLTNELSNRVQSISKPGTLAIAVDMVYCISCAHFLPMYRQNILKNAKRRFYSFLFYHCYHHFFKEWLYLEDLYWISWRILPFCCDWMGRVSTNYQENCLFIFSASI